MERMSTGRTHAMATVILGGVLAPGLFLLGHVALENSLAFASGCMLGLVVNPDLDLRRFTHAEQVVRDSGGPLGRTLAGLWYALWWPYAHLIPFHRHSLSHFPLVGTALRLIYLGAIIGLLYWLAGWVIALPDLLPLPGPLASLFWWGTIGLAAVDGLHTLMDII
jgi:uncharacterized metal-binding protein